MTERRLFPCELHCHTVHSDGDFTVAELISAAKSRHLEGICLTDHNTVSGWDEAEDGSIAVLKGIEWTTYFGHMKVSDCEKYVDWRDATPDNIDEKMCQIKKQSALVGIAHPFQVGTPVCTGGHWDFKVRDFSLVNYLEIWSEGCPYLNSPNQKAQKMWHDLLDRGYRIAPTFGRDWHRLRGNISPAACTYLLCEDRELTADMMHEAIERGRTAVSVGPEFIFFTDKGESVGDRVSPGEVRLKFKINSNRMKKISTEKVEYDIIKIITNGSEVFAELSSWDEEYVFEAEKGKWYSFELWGRIDGRENCQLAVTAPVYCE